MPTKTNEQALESSIEFALTGTCQEEIKEGAVINIEERKGIYRRNFDYYTGDANDFDAQYALDLNHFWTFLKESQPNELKKLQRSNDWELKILQRFERMIKKYGVLHLLKKGLQIEDANFTLFYESPLASSSEAVKENFKKNRFSISRQIRYSQSNTLQELDMVVFINGIPIITMELKNPWTGQNARVHAQNQYRTQRDQKQPLMQFARCLVHLAVDTEEIYMTTKLNGKKTFFLPFNKGNNHGKGNPINPNGHKTAYLWDEILQKESLANIIQHFVLLETGDKDKKNVKLADKNLIFPRYQQMDVVRKIIDHAANNGVGHKYLIQHSAGSGKSNSITWAAYQLIETYPKQAGIHGSKGEDQVLFDSVIVVTDRRLLDKQIKDNITDFSEVKNIVAHADSSKELRTNLESGKRIIITTIQKFPFIIDGIADLSNKRFAVIIDEAHSSQSGSAHDNMNRAMGQETNGDEDDGQDKILKAMQSRKMKGNASYLAFTATPKNTTLEKFGIKTEGGSFVPFHLYSMKQAIEEGFILDVLANYTTYKSYYEIEKSIEDNPLFDVNKAQKKLRSFVEQHEHTIATKAEVMIDHFTKQVVAPRKLRGKAKAMVVTQSIESAIRYYQAINKILDKKKTQFKGNSFKALIAFSGTKKVDGIEYTEAEMNGFKEKDTRERFDLDENRILVVANKYLTGFDQPKLSTMYVDKKLQGVLAVQALSRLNRSANSLSKKTEDLFVLDFFNKTEDIKTSFDPFYTSTSLSEATDVNVLHELKGNLDTTHIYEDSEVNDFAQKYFDAVDANELSPILDTAAERFNVELDLEDDEKADIKIKAKQFVKIYGQMASILPYELVEWEKLFWFLKFLIPKLLIQDPNKDALDELLNSVDLSTYGLERVKLNESISLDEHESDLDPQNPNPRGAHGSEEEKDELEEIINAFNARYFEGWDITTEDQRVKFLQLGRFIQEHKDYHAKYVNNPDPQTSDLVFDKMVGDTMSSLKKKEMALYQLFAKDPSFKSGLIEMMKRIVGQTNVDVSISQRL